REEVRRPHRGRRPDASGSCDTPPQGGTKRGRRRGQGTPEGLAPLAGRDRAVPGARGQHAAARAGVPGAVTKLPDHQGSLSVAPQALPGSAAGRRHGAASKGRAVQDRGPRHRLRPAGRAEPVPIPPHRADLLAGSGRRRGGARRAAGHVVPCDRGAPNLHEDPGARGHRRHRRAPRYRAPAAAVPAGRGPRRPGRAPPHGRIASGGKRERDARGGALTGRFLRPPMSRHRMATLDERLVSLVAPHSYEAEQYRGPRHLVEQAHRTSALSVLAVSSATVGDGKTTTAINLAGALAQAADARVLLMDVDLRRPAIAERLGVEEGRHGLVDAILSHDLKLADVARPCGPLNLAVVTAGVFSDIPYELLRSPRLGDLLEQARRDYDYVVLDTPPP